MAVATVDAKLAGVNRVRERHGLDRLVAHAGVFGRKIIGHARDEAHPDEQRRDGEVAREPIGPLWKNVRHAEPDSDPTGAECKGSKAPENVSFSSRSLRGR